MREIDENQISMKTREGERRGKWGVKRMEVGLKVRKTVSFSSFVSESLPPQQLN